MASHVAHGSDQTTASLLSSGKTKQAPQSTKNDGILLQLPVSEEFLDEHPKLRLSEYDRMKKNSASNALALIHNAGRREIAELITLVLPACEARIRRGINDEQYDLASLGNDVRDWWRLFARFSFFVSEAEEGINSKGMSKFEKMWKRHPDDKVLRNLLKLRKSINDRNSAAMEIIFRAADKAISELAQAPCQDKLKKVMQALSSVSNFLLDTYVMSNKLISTIEGKLIQGSDADMHGVEENIAATLLKINGDDRACLMMMLLRWMENTAHMKQWCSKHLSVRTRHTLGDWQKTYEQQRLQVVSRLQNAAG